MESMAARKFWEEEGCDIMAQHSDTSEPQKVFSENGGFGIGYNSDMRVLVGDSVLTSAILQWGRRSRRRI
jgi:basic membrane protein A